MDLRELNVHGVINPLAIEDCNTYTRVDNSGNDAFMSNTPR